MAAAVKREQARTEGRIGNLEGVPVYIIGPLVILQGMRFGRISEPLGQFSKSELPSPQDDCGTCILLSSVRLTHLVSYMDLPDMCRETQGTCSPGSLTGESGSELIP